MIGAMSDDDCWTAGVDWEWQSCCTSTRAAMETARRPTPAEAVSAVVG